MAWHKFYWAPRHTLVGWKWRQEVWFAVKHLLRAAIGQRIAVECSEEYKNIPVVMRG